MDEIEFTIAKKLSAAINNGHDDIVECLSEHLDSKVLKYLMLFGSTKQLVFNYIKKRPDMIDLLVEYTKGYNSLHKDIIYEYILGLKEIPDELMYNIGTELGLDSNERRMVIIIKKFGMKKSVYERLCDRCPGAYRYTSKFITLWDNHLVDG